VVCGTFVKSCVAIWEERRDWLIAGTVFSVILSIYALAAMLTELAS
jgi:hypothetical protein